MTVLEFDFLGCSGLRGQRVEDRSLSGTGSVAVRAAEKNPVARAAQSLACDATR